MDIEYPIADIEKFAPAFYLAAKAYYYHRFNSRAPASYFLDALYHYYHSEISFISNAIGFGDSLEYYDRESEYESILMIGERKITLRMHAERYVGNFQQIQVEEFILRLGSHCARADIPFPPIRPFISFPARNKYPGFTEPTFPLQYPTDFAIFSRLSYDIAFLRQWLHDSHVLLDTKIVFILGYNSGIQRTLSRFLLEVLIDSTNELYGYIETYCYYIDDVNHDELLTYLKTGKMVEGLQSSYGNYQIRPIQHEILTVTSNLKFVNSVGRIPLRNPIPEIVLEEPNEDNLLGEGSFGKVYSTNNPNIVVKAFDPEDPEFDYEIQSVNFVNRYLKSFSHVSRVLGYDLDKKMLQMEKLYPLPNQVNPFISQDGKLPIFLQIVQGLYSLHSSGLAHNDIKGRKYYADYRWRNSID